MKNLMKQAWNIAIGKNERILTVSNQWIFPLIFTFSYLLNFIFYYLGLAFSNNAVRSYGFIIGAVLFACVCFWAFFHAIRRQQIGWKRGIMLGLVVAFFFVCFLLGLFHSATRGVMFENAKSFAFFAFPAFLAGVVAATNRTEDNFFCALEKLSFFALPGAAIYMCGALFNCNPGRNLGILNYMTVAYALMPLFLSLVVRFSEKAELPIPFTNRYFKRPQVVRGIMLAIYWIALIATATRGMYVCVAFFCALFVLSRWIRREPAKRAFWLSTVLAAALLFTMFVYAPPGMRAVSRMTGFVQDLANGEFSTSDEERPEVSDLIDDMIDADGDKQIANQPSKPGDPSDNDTDFGQTIKISNRSTLFKLALGEFAKSPLTGMGPGGYSFKYGMYPHNILLESLCEIGLPASLFIIALTVLAVIKLAIAGWQDRNIWYILIFLLTYILQANISGSVWNCPPLLCTLGYGLAMALPKRTNK